MQYLAGYVFHKTFIRIRKSKSYYNNAELQWCAQLLKDSKIECEEEQNDKQLIAIKNRGGLWSVCHDAEMIFVEIEKIFRKQTGSFRTKIDQARIIEKALINSNVLDYFRSSCDKTDVMEIEWADKLLERVLVLYIRVQTHSYAKDIKEQFKHKAKQNRKRALRTELKKANDETNCSER